MPNKGKKSGSRPTKQSKKGKSNSAVEISRSFAKKDANISNQTSSVNQNLVGDDSSIKPDFGLQMKFDLIYWHL